MLALLSPPDETCPTLTHLRTAASASVLRVQHLQHLDLPAPSDARWAGFFGDFSEGLLGKVPRSRRLDSSELSAITKGFWCTTCPITRRGAVIQQHNRSVVRQLEQFCKTEARGLLGQGPPMRSCCGRSSACHKCEKFERRTVSNASQLPWPTSEWIALYAKLDLPAPSPICEHPFCTGADRKHFP